MGRATNPALIQTDNGLTLRVLAQCVGHATFPGGLAQRLHRGRTVSFTLDKDNYLDRDETFFFQTWQGLLNNSPEEPQLFLTALRL